MTRLKRSPTGCYSLSSPQRETSLRRSCSIIFSGLLLWILLIQPVHPGFASGKQRATVPAQSAFSPVNEQQVTSGVVQMTMELSTLSGWQRINVLDVDLTNPHVRLGIVQEHDRLLGPGETLTSMALRTGAVAGINGDFFEINASGDELGMLEIDGQLWQSPASFAVLGLTASGRLTIGPETFSGSVTAGTVSYPLRSVNRHNDASSANGLTLFTPTLGAALPLSGAAVAFLRPTARSRSVFTVESVQAEVTTLPVLVNQDALVGNGAAASWLLAHLEPGATIAVSEQIAPDDTLVQAIGGGALLLKDGAFYQDTRAPAPKTSSPLTAVGVSRDGRHALLIVCDGRQADPEQSAGLTPWQMARYLWMLGAYQAMLFDGGGSSEMVARLPGQQQVSVLNAPSDGHERPVANGLFLYNTEENSPYIL